MLKILAGAARSFAFPHQAAFAQRVNATIPGKVTDSTGAIIPNYGVTLTQKETSPVNAATTNESGNCTLPNTTPGTYRVAVEMDRADTSTNIGAVQNANLPLGTNRMAITINRGQRQ